MALQKPVKILQMAELKDQGQSDMTQQKLSEKQIDELYNSYSRMKEFIKSLVKDQSGELGKIVSEYSNRNFDFQMSVKSAMHIVDKRIQRMMKNKKMKKNWSDEDTKILLWTLSHYALNKGLTSIEQLGSSDWTQISSLIPGSTPDSCMFKVLSLKNVLLSQKKWSEHEEALLAQIVSNKKQKNWRLISQELFKKNRDPNKIFRSSKQCKEHWICYLDSSIRKGPWDAEQDRKLLTLISANNGAKKWAYISRIFKGRTENALKNRYTLIIQRLKKQTNEKDQLSIIRSYLETQYPQKTEETVHIENRTAFRKLSQEIKVEKQNKTDSGLPRQQPKVESVPLVGQPSIEMNGVKGQFPILFCAPSFFWLFGTNSE